MELRILCVHGVGNHPTGELWEGEWKEAIVESLRMLGGDVAPVVELVFRRYFREASNRRGRRIGGDLRFHFLAKTLRHDRRLKKPQLTFDSLIREVRKELVELGYAQKPVLIAPSEIKNRKFR